MPIPVIDLFAGPGGLGEGLSALRCDRRPVFKIRLSIEKDLHAHRTLELRAFYRQFADGHVPEDYYDYLFGLISRDELFAKYSAEARGASLEAWHAEMGSTSFPDSLIDDRIRDAIGGGTNWVLIGGPPCQAYSLAGRARRTNDPDFQSDERHTLYRQYLRIIAVHQPPVFVMENVKGLLSATLQKEHIFHRILSDLQNPLDTVDVPRLRAGIRRLSYRLVSLVVRNDDPLGFHEPQDFLVKCENYGIPQARHRIIILGINAAATATPGLLRTQAPVRVEDVISDLPPLRSALSREPDSPEAWYAALSATVGDAWFQSPKVTPSHRRELQRVLSVIDRNMDTGGELVRPTGHPIRAHREWFFDPRLAAVCNHRSRPHMRTDLHRYLFASTFAHVHGRAPILKDFPAELLPNHRNVPQALGYSNFNDRFNVQLAGLPATTITSHIAKDGHYFIHYDAAQCRSLTVREAARIQTFPDNYLFEGPRTEQYKQVGNAVPPLLARQIAEIVRGLFG